jgi:beta-glucanase (GH16 family)
MSSSAFTTSQTNTRVLFFDDFRSGELDRSKWNVRITGNIYNNEQQAYVDSVATISIAAEDEVPGANQSALVIRPQYRPDYISAEGYPFDFISGRIDTRDKFDFRYGSAAARMLLPSGAGLWPAFWINGHENWPASGEIDVMEYVGERDWVSSAVHGPEYSGEAGLVNKLFFPTGEDATAWHVYSVDWQPDSLLFKVDGRTTYRVTRQMTDFFGRWVFDNNKHLILNFALGGTYPFKTNGVKRPYYGLPDPTVELIKKGDVKLAIDWIKVSTNTT